MAKTAPLVAVTVVLRNRKRVEPGEPFCAPEKDAAELRGLDAARDAVGKEIEAAKAAEASEADSTPAT